ncbi:MAG: hypothetical protein A3F72_05805 [Bacteroidetes bacterium RIFCSPLOWO2_12_FULL_35_15]|nr:MAG: hypothetical protein A3F72_05805 [Bacteroidetes bacterium RIFCSPLOWO2_12_FULL_35_15]
MIILDLGFINFQNKVEKLRNIDCCKTFEISYIIHTLKNLFPVICSVDACEYKMRRAEFLFLPLYPFDTTIQISLLFIISLVV